MIFLSWADRLRSLEKIAEDFGARLSPSLSLSSSFLLLANDSCCDRCQDASLPQAITQWPPFFLRGYHAPIAESADPREIMDCHDALSITGLRTSANTPGYPRVVPRFRRATRFFDKPLLTRPCTAERSKTAGNLRCAELLEFQIPLLKYWRPIKIFWETCHKVS